uniref:Uncharacterized protein n=1 Tax=Eptatretus burgeri TaxID=7764 RepID=A0A8C4QI43_EPTBU
MLFFFNLQFCKCKPNLFVHSLQPLKKALRMMGAPNLIADNAEFGLSYSVISYLKKLSQQAKVESERVISLVGKKLPQETGQKVRGRPAIAIGQNKELRQLLALLGGEGSSSRGHHDFPGFQMAVLNREVKPQPFRNAYDIPRHSLLDQLNTHACKPFASCCPESCGPTKSGRR